MKHFNESHDTAIFTTRFVLENNSPVVYVVHDEDGDWQFHGTEEASEDDARIITLGEMFLLDRSILELSQMPVGYCAFRENVASTWTIEKDEE